jgi:uncharacterized membrane protein
MMQTDIVAITFTDKEGAQTLLNTLGELTASGALSKPDDVVVVVKDEDGRVQVRETAVSTHPRSAKVSEPGLVAGLLLGGPVANTLLGEAAGTLLAYHIELGVPLEQVNSIANDMIAGSSILFIQGCAHWNGSFHSACDHSGGKLYDLPLTRQAVSEVKILSSTLTHYWT